MPARIAFFVIIISMLFTARPVFAEIKIFEKDLDEIVSNDQSREQVEAFTLQKAKRLAIEEAGTYIQSLTVVQNYQLTKDEVTALSSGVVQAKIIGVPEVLLVNGVIHVKVKARIQVDTSILEKQIAEIMKEKGTLIKLAAEQAKVKELEGRLSTLKSTELKRLEELNAQAIALEQEREKQRLFREEQGLKAQGELKKTEIERLQKERELQERTAKLINEQEKQRKQEAVALANEQDRIRHAQMENEQRWADLVRKSQLAQQNWLVIDNSLSLKQALVEVKMIKQELASLKKRMEYQFEENVNTLKKAYALQIEFMKPKLPPPLTGKDPFETTEEYATRLTIYESAVKEAESENALAIDDLHNEVRMKAAQAKVDYVEQKIKLSTPFIERLRALQARKFILSGEQVTIDLGPPDADRSCFPATVKYNEKKWTVDWKYQDRNRARDIYNTRTYLKAEALVQIDETKNEGYSMTAARVNHPGTREQALLTVAEEPHFAEVTEFDDNSNKVLNEAKKEFIAAKAIIERRRQYFPSTSRFELSRDGVSVYDTQTGLIWAQNANLAGRGLTWKEAMMWVKGINVGGYKDWHLPTDEELEILAKAGGKSSATWLNSVGFSNVQADDYWSSTSTGGSDFAWYVNMKYCEVIRYDKTANKYVWPVRAGQ